MKEFARTSLLLGEENIKKLSGKNILLCGVGGVGSYVLEGLVRMGIGSFTIVDFDVVDITNINRQLIALHSTIGKKKVEVAKARVLDINKEVRIKALDLIISEETIDEIVGVNYDYIIDAIDDVKGKIALIKKAKELNIPIISSMGTGNKLDPTKLKIMDLNQTSYCPLAKKMRYELRKIGITHLKVLSSLEMPHEVITDDPTVHTVASVSFVPSSGGLLIVSEVIKDLLK